MIGDRTGKLRRGLLTSPGPRGTRENIFGTKLKVYKGVINIRKVKENLVSQYKQKRKLKKSVGQEVNR